MISMLYAHRRKDEKLHEAKFSGMTPQRNTYDKSDSSYRCLDSRMTKISYPGQRGSSW